MATVALPPTDPMASEPWREEECHRFYVELDLLPLPFDTASREPVDPWASLTSALPHRSQREVVAFAHAEYHRMYTDPKHAQLLQDFPLGLWSAQDDTVFEAALGSAALGEMETETEPLDLLSKCLPHKSAAAIKEQAALHSARAAPPHTLPVRASAHSSAPMHLCTRAPLHQVAHLQDDVRAIESGEPPVGRTPGAEAPPQAQPIHRQPAQGQPAALLSQGADTFCGGGASAAGSSAQHQGVGGSWGGGGAGGSGGLAAAAAEGDYPAADKKRERGTPWTAEEHKVCSY